ncbi:MAG: fasciclin domain-containing protein [Chitinophagaceae bacterium]
MSNLTQVVNTDKYLKTLKKGIHASDFDQLLSSTGPYTFFAPSDSAFEKLDAGMMDNLLTVEKKPELSGLINNHIVAGKFLFKDLKDGDKLTTLSGSVLKVSVDNGNVTVNGAGVHQRDAKISNGVMHSIDTVFSAQ